MSISFDVVLPPPQDVAEPRKRSLEITIQADKEVIDVEPASVLVEGFECEEGDVIILGLTDFGWDRAEPGKISTVEVVENHPGVKIVMPPSDPCPAGRLGVRLTTSSKAVGNFQDNDAMLAWDRRQL